MLHLLLTRLENCAARMAVEAHVTVNPMVVVMLETNELPMP